MAKVAKCYYGVELVSSGDLKVVCLDSSGQRQVAKKYPVFTSFLDSPIGQELVKNRRSNRLAVGIGQNILTRFIKLPPIDTKKVADVIRYEARQQIPFELQDVAWDFCKVSGKFENDFILGTYLLEAVKKDRLERDLKPFSLMKMKVHFVQSILTAMGNALSDKFNLGEVQEDWDNPPPTYLMLSVNTDGTSLVASNGVANWNRTIPIAEPLSASPTKMLDFLTEVRRSIAYYKTANRGSKLMKLILLGNAFKDQAIVDQITKEFCGDPALEGGPERHFPNASNVVEQDEFILAEALAKLAMGKSKLTTNMIMKKPAFKWPDFRKWIPRLYIDFPFWDDVSDGS
jgi:hypothetical protein